MAARQHCIIKDWFNAVDQTVLIMQEKARPLRIQFVSTYVECIMQHKIPLPEHQACLVAPLRVTAPWVGCCRIVLQGNKQLLYPSDCHYILHLFRQ